MLVVEDEFLIALEVDDALRRAGVVGPVATPEDAARLATEEQLDAAVLDVELRGGRVFPAADALARLSVPFVFLMGYAPGGAREVAPRVLRADPAAGAGERRLDVARRG